MKHKNPMTNEEWQDKVKEALHESVINVSSKKDRGHPFVIIKQLDDVGDQLGDIELAGIVRNGSNRLKIFRRQENDRLPAQKQPTTDSTYSESDPSKSGSKTNHLSIWDLIQQELDGISEKDEINPLSRDFKDGIGSSFPLNCIFSGPPGTGKTWAAKELLKEIKNKDKGQYAEVCFHPATAYEDFVRALESDGKGAFVAKNKAFGDICDRAFADPEKLYAILIDEINRANLPAVLGQLMTALEYRGGDNAVTVPHQVNGPVDSTNNPLRDPDKLVVPHNLLVIGTMNTADRTTGLLDYALRRRFVFFPFKPVLSKAHEDASKRFEAVLGLFYDHVSPELSGRSEILAPEFEPDDVAIGHSYFRGENWKFKAKYQVAPLLEEYIRDGVLTDRNKVNEVIEFLHNL